MLQRHAFFDSFFTKLAEMHSAKLTMEGSANILYMKWINKAKINWRVEERVERIPTWIMSKLGKSAPPPRERYRTQHNWWYLEFLRAFHLDWRGVYSVVKIKLQNLSSGCSSTLYWSRRRHWHTGNILRSTIVVLEWKKKYNVNSHFGRNWVQNLDSYIWSCPCYYLHNKAIKFTLIGRKHQANKE